MKQTAEKQIQYKIIPELGCLAAIILSNIFLSFDEKTVVVRDLYTQYLRNFDMVYYPGEEPVENRCPVASYSYLLEI